ncbi:MAG: transglutaminase domain-containing protein, partial [Anaerolineales bacterium]|nr:transglutaminase domain-containing protein [Anaerolineales bacterium]
MKLREGWSTALLLAGMVLACASIYTATDWASGLETVLWAGLGGLIAGLLLGWSVFSSAISHWMAAVYGLAWLGFLWGRQLPSSLTGRERIVELASHLGYWVEQAFGGGTGRDPLIFLMFLGALFWTLGYNAAWNTYRHARPWWAVIPLAVAGLVAMIYYIGPASLIGYLALFLFLALLYVARMHLFEREQEWQAQQVGYSSDMRFKIVQASVLLASAVILLAWALPSAAAMPRAAAVWRRLSNPWQAVQDEWQRLFSTQQAYEAAGIVEPFGPTLALGGDRNVADVVIMDVVAPREGRYYWRGASYSFYTGNRWEAPETGSILLIPNRRPPGLEEYALRHVITQTVTSYGSARHLLVAASQLVSVDREAEAYADRSGEAPLDFVRVFGVLPLETGDEYTAESYVSIADATSLRRANVVYPEWVLGRYLQLPTALPERVRLLSEEITVGAGNAYDRAVVIEQFLRQHITYDLNPPEKPARQDYVDFLLFDSQRDYCNGYATAMVVMARSVGIPARLAVGYAQGEYDAQRGFYRVRERNAHAWPELYFPEYGWLEFEPTVSELPLIRPDLAEDEGAGAEDVPRGAGEDLSELENPLFFPGLYPETGEGVGQLSPQSRFVVWPWALALALVGLGMGGWWAMENWGLGGLSPVEGAYARLLRFGRWLGRPLRHSDTPSEWARDVASIAPNARAPIERVVDLFVRARFA